MIDLVYKVAAFLLALGVLITFHELGHYLVARLSGVKVLRFSVGFGKPLWMRRFGRDQTEWAIAAIPIGGYVRMLDEREAEVPEGERHRAFNRQPVARKIAIVVAGPLANFLLAILFYAVINWVGFEGERTLVAAPPSGSPAASAGLQAHDEILAVNDVAIPSWQELRWRLLLASGDEAVKLTVRRGTDTTKLSLPLTALGKGDWERNFPALLGLADDRIPMPPIVSKVVDDKPAARAGVQVNDRILAINGQAMKSAAEVARFINAHPDETLRVEFERGGTRQLLTVLTDGEVRDDRRVGTVGVQLSEDPASYQHMLTTVRYGLGEALLQAVRKTAELSVFSLRMLGRIVIGEASLKNISGPVTMADYAGRSAQQGTDNYLRYLALISVSLAVLNLLPIPLLDGGHLVYYIAELIKGRPVSDRAFEIGQQIGIVLLFGLMTLALYNDIARLLS